jgi:hypothetical protein
MSRQEALFIVNQLHDQISALAREIVKSLEDNKISIWEGFRLSMQSTTLASTVMGILQNAPPEVRKDLLYILEHGDWILPPGLE